MLIPVARMTINSLFRWRFPRLKSKDNRRAIGRTTGTKLGIKTA